MRTILVTAALLATAPFAAHSAAAAEFSAVYVAPVAIDLDLNVTPSRNGGDRAMSDDDVAEKASDFRDEIVDAFADDYAIVDAPGPGVLSVDVTLTYLQSTKPTMEDLRDEPGLDYVRSTYAGGADYEATLSVNGEVIAELDDSYRGSFGDGRTRIATWADANRAFSRFARQIEKAAE